MFWTVLGEVLTPGLGAALSPMAIVAAVLLASAPGGVRRSFLFALASFLALTVLGMSVLLLSNGADVGVKSGPSTAVTVLRLVLGILFVIFAWVTFKKRPRKGEKPKTQRWMSALDTMSTGRVLLLGLTMGFLNAKNLPLSINVATSVAETGASTAVADLGILIFAFLGSLGVLAPGMIKLLVPQDAERILNAIRSFFVDHNAAIMTVLLLMLGVNAIGKSLGPLFG